MRRKPETGQDSLRRLRYYLRQTRQGIPIAAAMLVIALIGLWIAGHWFRVPTGMKAILIGVTAFSFVMEVVSFLHLRSKIKRMTGEPTGEK
jgi:hypothetical protein